MSKHEIEAGSNRTEILQHTIEWWVRDENLEVPIVELGEAEEERLESLIKEGYREGELAIYISEKDATYYGWWKIVPCSC